MVPNTTAQLGTQQLGSVTRHNDCSLGVIDRATGDGVISATDPDTRKCTDLITMLQMEQPMQRHQTKKEQKQLAPLRQVIAKENLETRHQDETLNTLDDSDDLTDWTWDSDSDDHPIQSLSPPKRQVVRKPKKGRLGVHKPKKGRIGVHARIEKNIYRSSPKYVLSRFGWADPPTTMDFDKAMAMMGLEVSGNLSN